MNSVANPKRIIVGLLAVMLAINILHLIQIGQKANGLDNYATVSTQSNKSIFAISQDESPSARGIFTVWDTLGRVAPGSKYYFSHDLNISSDRTGYKTHAHVLGKARYAEYQDFSSASIQQAVATHDVTDEKHVFAYSTAASRKIACFIVYTKHNSSKSFDTVYKNIYVKKQVDLGSRSFIVGLLDSKSVGASIGTENSCSDNGYLAFFDEQLIPDSRGF